MKQYVIPALLGCLLVAPLASQAAKSVAGKIVAVSHEKVTNNNVVSDKITVSIDSCDARGTIKTVFYSPATVSDRTALGHLFQEDLDSARTPNMEKQQTPNGFGLFWVDDNNKVLRTGILGDHVDCSLVSQLLTQFP